MSTYQVEQIQKKRKVIEDKILSCRVKLENYQTEQDKLYKEIKQFTSVDANDLDFTISEMEKELLEAEKELQIKLQQLEDALK
jgi:hypothetical protein